MGGGLTLAGVDPNHRSHFIWEEPAGEYPGGQGLSKLSMDVQNKVEISRCSEKEIKINGEENPNVPMNRTLPY